MNATTLTRTSDLTSTSYIAAKMTRAKGGEVIYHIAFLSAHLEAPLFFLLIVHGVEVEHLHTINSSLDKFLDAPCAALKLERIDETGGQLYTTQLPGLDLPVVFSVYHDQIEHYQTYTKEVLEAFLS